MRERVSLIQIGDVVEWAGRAWCRYIYDNTRIDEVDLDVSPEGNRVGDRKTVKHWYGENNEHEMDVEIEWDGESWRRLI